MKIESDSYWEIIVPDANVETMRIPGAEGDEDMIHFLADAVSTAHKTVVCIQKFKLMRYSADIIYRRYILYGYERDNTTSREANSQSASTDGS